MTKTYAEYVEESKKRKPSIHLAPSTARAPGSPTKEQKPEQPPLDSNGRWFPRSWHKNKQK